MSDLELFYCKACREHYEASFNHGLNCKCTKQKPITSELLDKIIKEIKGERYKKDIKPK